MLKSYMNKIILNLPCVSGDGLMNNPNESAFQKYLIISHTSFGYIFFQFCITLLSLFSSYFYLGMATFREHLIVDKNDLDNTDSSDKYVYAIESCFILNICVKFITDYGVEGSKLPERDLSKIAKNYFNSDFTLDLIPIIPFQFITHKNGRHFLYYLIKMIRLWQGFKIFDVQKIMGYIKKFYQKKLEYLVANNDKLANNIVIDNNSIEEVLFIKYFLKLIKFVIIILNVSYILGMMWLIMCKAIEDFVYDVKYKEMFNNDGSMAAADYKIQHAENMDIYEENFIVKWDLYNKLPYENTIIVMYYAFTSLSTVGFGDLHPRSDIERMACAFMLLIGVMLFSTIMNGFIDMINEFKDYDAEISDGDNLTRFFGTVKKFNSDKQIDIQLKK